MRALLSAVPIANWWPVGPVLLVLLALAVLAAYGARRIGRPVGHRVAVGIALVLAVAQVACVVNAQVEYYRTPAEALGEPASDEVGLARAQRADGRVPPQGVVLPLPVPAVDSGFSARTAMVYLPPAWFAADRPELPVVMLLHGEPGSPQDWLDGGQAQETADAWAAAHRGVAPVLVMPDVNGSLDGDSECVDSPLGNAETYLVRDVPEAVHRELGTRPAGAGWAVAGFSEGGTCSIMLALRHPDLFATFGDFSGLLGPRLGETNADTASTVAVLFDGSAPAFDAHDPAALLAGRRYPGLGGWFEVGDADLDPLAATTHLAPAAEQAGLDTCLVVVPGGEHGFDVWDTAFARWLPWTAVRLGLTPPGPSTCPPG